MLPFPKSARILRSAEFRKVYDNGVRVSGPLFAAFCLKRVAAPAASLKGVSPQPDDVGTPVRSSFSHPILTGVRLGLTVPKAVGKAVARNRIKRRLREAFRLQRPNFGNAGDWDVVLNPRRAVLNATFSEIEVALRKVMARCK
ncbi:MAG: ribonuclease P protein component [Acidobacteriota bacterium]